MWKCHKCGKPVYFAERKQSLGYDWHPECLRCEECSKRLNPGQHAEHKGVPYCHVPCYGALFGPQLFGHGTRVESHTSFGKVENRSGTPNLPRSTLEHKLKTFNQYYEGKSGKIHCREVNGRLVLEGALRIYWGVVGVIHLKEEYDQRTVVTVRKRNSYLFSNGNSSDDMNSVDGERSVSPESPGSPEKVPATNKTEQTENSESPSRSITSIPSEVPSNTLPAKLDDPKLNWDELDDFLQVERKLEVSEKPYQTMPSALPSSSGVSSCSQSPSLEASKSSDNLHNSTNEQPTNLNGGTDSVRSCSADNSPDLSVSSEDSYSRNFEENVESEKRMQRSQSMPPESSGDDFWADESLGDDYDDDDLSLRQLDRSVSVPESVNSSSSSGIGDSVAEDGEVPQLRRKAAKTGSAAIRRRSGRRRSRTKLRRRCSINGHFYDRDTSFFTPPNGSSTSVWVTSLVSTQEVVNLILDKYRVDSTPDNFALFVVYDNGEQRRMREDEYPLLTRVMLGPHEDVARIQIVDRHSTSEVSNEVAQFINLSLAECSAILERYHQEERRQIANIQAKYREMRKRIKQRMEELKVRL